MRVVEAHITATVHEFFSQQWVLLLAGRVTTRGRREFRSRLTGPVALKEGSALDVSALPERDVHALLVARGAPDTCVLVKDGLVEDEITTLSSALHRVFLSREGALISCIPGRLGFLQSDGGRTRLLLGAGRSTAAAAPGTSQKPPQ
ncbi:hypothetical protein [Leifsonia sp. 1010]|uniref:hypothetical protein n=1 Tax=Leifsonia sp. 1010 TaxID=2817769 RepID=UPI00285E8DED|nr:hypothetical protein [Leifsonia sp. 1010]MDR6612025.1 hypothetical protein [Leifsonia sp. 1010]